MKFAATIHGVLVFVVLFVCYTVMYFSLSEALAYSRRIVGSIGGFVYVIGYATCSLYKTLLRILYTIITHLPEGNILQYESIKCVIFVLFHLSPY